MSKSNGYTTGNLLDYLYNVNYHKVIGLVLSKQTNTSILSKLILQENYKNMMLLYCFLLVNSSKKRF